MMTDKRPQLSTVIRRALEDWGADLRVSMPATIVTYDETTQLASVKPLFTQTVAGGVAEGLPTILEVPVRWPRVGLAVMYMPLKPGDKVGLIFTDRSLDNWERSDGDSPVDPQDVRTHDLTDAWIIPGLYPPTDPIPNIDPADIRIILFDTSGAVRSQFYLGGDTGDIVSLAENLIMLGSATSTEHGVLGDVLKTELSNLAQSFIDNAATIVNVTATPGPGILNPTVVTALTTFIVNLINILSTKMRLV